MVAHKYDYDSLERQYVQGDMSIRELAKMNDAKESSVIQYSRRHDWQSRRAMWRGRVDEKTTALTVTREAQRRAKAMDVYDKAFDVVAKVFDRVIEDLSATHWVKEHDKDGLDIWVERPRVTVSPTQAATLIDRMNVLLGRPESITEQRSNIDFNNADPNVLVAILERSRSEARSGGVGGSSVPRIEGPREADEPRELVGD